MIISDTYPTLETQILCHCIVNVCDVLSCLKNRNILLIVTNVCVIVDINRFTRFYKVPCLIV